MTYTGTEEIPLYMYCIYCHLLANTFIRLSNNHFLLNDKSKLILFSFPSTFSVTVPGYQGNLQAAISHSASLAAWERFGVEFSLTFVVVLTYFVSTDSMKRFMGNSATTVGSAYSACSFVSVSRFYMPSSTTSIYIHITR